MKFWLYPLHTKFVLTLGECSIPVPPKNVRKADTFWLFQGLWKWNIGLKWVNLKLGTQLEQNKMCYNSPKIPVVPSLQDFMSLWSISWPLPVLEPLGYWILKEYHQMHWMSSVINQYLARIGLRDHVCFCLGIVYFFGKKSFAWQKKCKHNQKIYSTLRWIMWAVIAVPNLKESLLLIFCCVRYALETLQLAG